MIIRERNIHMIRGDTEALQVKLQKEDGTPYFLEEGDIIYFTVKSSPRTEEKLLQKVITEFVDGVALITIEPEDTKELNFRKYQYDIQWTRADGTVKTIVPVSNFVIEEEITYD